MSGKTTLVVQTGGDREVDVMSENSGVEETPDVEVKDDPVIDDIEVADPVVTDVQDDESDADDNGLPTDDA